MFKSLGRSAVPHDKSIKQKTRKEQPELADDEHALIEQSSNSMVNMAISLDPLSAENALRKVEQEMLAKQKEAIQATAKQVLPEKFSPSPKKRPEVRPVNEPLIEGKAGYSADEFDSDSEDHGKSPLGLNKFVVSLGKAEEDVEGLL